MKPRIKPEQVIDILNEAGVQYLLVGAHMIGGWANQSRFTYDVDVLVSAKQIPLAVKVLALAFPKLEVRDTAVVVRFKDKKSGEILIDVMKPTDRLFQVAMRHVHTIKTKDRVYNVPNLEFALAMKFAAMVSPYRDHEKKHYDGGDFTRMVRANAAIDVKKLARLGERVYPQGGKEIVAMVQTIRAGRMLTYRTNPTS